MSYCQGFCRTCGTGCAQYLEAEAALKAEIEDGHARYRAAVDSFETISNRSMNQTKEVLCSRQEITKLKAENARLRGVASIVNYTDRSRGYPTPKEWAEIVSVTKQALLAAKQDETK